MDLVFYLFNTYIKLLNSNPSTAPCVALHKSLIISAQFIHATPSPHTIDFVGGFP